MRRRIKSSRASLPADMATSGVFVEEQAAAVQAASVRSELLSLWLFDAVG